MLLSPEAWTRLRDVVASAARGDVVLHVTAAATAMAKVLVKVGAMVVRTVATGRKDQAQREQLVQRDRDLNNRGRLPVANNVVNSIRTSAVETNKVITSIEAEKGHRTDRPHIETKDLNKKALWWLQKNKPLWVRKWLASSKKCSGDDYFLA